MFLNVLYGVYVVVFICSTSGEPLRFKDGKFKIAQFTDLHYGEDEFTPWGPIQDKNSNHVMHSVLTAEKPDFVLFTGDTLTGNNIGSNATEYWKYVLSPCLQHDTPWAHVFGNHDDLSAEHGDRDTLMKYDQTFNLSHSVRGPRDLFGVSNYFLPIYGEGSDRVEAVIYMLDSGGGQIEEQVTPDQITWLYHTYHVNMQEYGPVPSILTFHIPPPEFEDLFNTGQCTGYLNNTVLPLPSEGLYKTILSLPNLHLVTTGHYHENDYCCSTENKLLCQGRHSGYGGYSDIARGSRIIQLEKDKLQTWIRMENRNIVDHIILKYHNFAIQES
ncbi:hypothetical protein ACHWQZ_G012929 [Mnemiopsis leidyi]